MQLLSIEQGRSIRLAGELDLSSASQLQEVLDVAVAYGGTILVDLTELTFMDSTGINALLRAAISLDGRGCIILHGEQDRVRRVLDLVRLDGSIPNLHRVTHDIALVSDGHPEHSQASYPPPRRVPTSNQTLLPEPSRSTPHDVATASTRSKPQPLDPKPGLRRSGSNGGP